MSYAYLINRLYLYTIILISLAGGNLVFGELVKSSYHLHFEVNTTYELPTETPAALGNTPLPILKAEPAIDVSSGVFTAPDGAPAGVIHGNDRNSTLFSDCLKQSIFTPALIDNSPCWGYSNLKLLNFFYMEDNGAGCDELPVCLFRMDSKTLQFCFQIAQPPAAKNDDEPVSLKLRFKIDEKGKVASISADNKAGRTLIKKIFDQISPNFSFSPAMKNGVPVPCTLVLELRLPVQDKRGNIVASEFSPTAFELTAPYDGSEENTVSAYVRYKNDGTVNDIRLPASLGKNEAISLMDHLRKYPCPENIPATFSVPSVTFRLKFFPGSQKISLCEMELTPIVYPDDPKWLGSSAIRGLPIFKRMTAKAIWTVDTSGSIQNPLIMEAAPPVFKGRVDSILNKGESSPGSFDGRKVPFDVYGKFFGIVDQEETRIYTE